MFETVYTVSYPTEDGVTWFMNSTTSNDDIIHNDEILVVDHDIGGMKYVRSHPIVASVYLFIALTASIVGTIGNIFILLALALHGDLRHARNIFIANLAIADLCVTAFANPFGIIGEYALSKTF